MGFNRKVTEEEIENGLCLIARLIDRYGDSYWPIFERLESELEQRQSKRQHLHGRVQAYLNQPREV